jgi:hypothetical protein
MFSALLLTVGIALLILGLTASESVGSDLSRMFRGTPTDRATFLLLGGAAATVAGLVGVFLTFRPRPPG